ncbi:unnamed protein product, partial [marine sediment metagenome]
MGCDLTSYPHAALARTVDAQQIVWMGHVAHVQTLAVAVRKGQGDVDGVAFGQLRSTFGMNGYGTRTGPGLERPGQRFRFLGGEIAKGLIQIKLEPDSLAAELKEGG